MIVNGKEDKFGSRSDEEYERSGWSSKNEGRDISRGKKFRKRKNDVKVKFVERTRIGECWKSFALLTL